MVSTTLLTHACARRFGVWLAVATLTVNAAAAHATAGELVGVVSAGGRPAKNVVVWLAIAPPPEPPPRHAVLDQRNMQFAPLVLGVPVGTRVDMPNSDRVFHNVFSFHDGRVFDLGLYPAGTSKAVTFDRAGLSRIFCNIHPNMAAYVMAVDSTYVAVSDAQGRFSIPGVADGSFTYHAWRAGAETVTGTLVVRSGQTVDLTLP